MLIKKLVPTVILSIVISATLIGCSKNKSDNVDNASIKSEASEVNETNAMEVGSYPIHQVLNKVDNFDDFRIIDVRQEFNTSETTKTEATVILTKEGLADDSVEASRIKYNFKLEDGKWKEVSKEDSWRCGRGPNTTEFQKKLCP
ncbi:hypothetical protein F889_02792 [Acinetobacter colistiniresistens]|uniref:Lipoprotein n=1 Tax=Acinetobacter colistiniresistens TaxID=280145 RepID=N9PL08_9GAMM|nr:hypothetical protein [Acinetobacter colistiniresistens]ENX34128.1 hypothetical protein F889_02792 [Acinetobacter colistiniresistens]